MQWQLPDNHLRGRDGSFTFPFSLPLFTHTRHYRSKVSQLSGQHKRPLHIAREKHNTLVPPGTQASQRQGHSLRQRRYTEA